MTLDQLVVGCGVVLSAFLLTVLASYWPGSRRRCVLSMNGVGRVPRRRDERVAVAHQPLDAGVAVAPHPLRVAR